MNARPVAKLNAFFDEIRRLTSNHDVIADHACVTADKLGKALEKVDPEWWKNVPPMTEAERKQQIHTSYENQS